MSTSSFQSFFVLQIVKNEGGYEDVTRLRRWSRVALLMGYGSAQASAVLRRHYEKILYPYDVFMSGAMTGDDDPQTSSISPKVISLQDHAFELIITDK